MLLVSLVLLQDPLRLKFKHEIIHKKRKMIRENPAKQSDAEKIKQQQKITFHSSYIPK